MEDWGAGHAGDGRASLCHRQYRSVPLRVSSRGRRGETQTEPPAVTVRRFACPQVKPRFSGWQTQVCVPLGTDARGRAGPPGRRRPHSPTRLLCRGGRNWARKQSWTRSSALLCSRVICSGEKAASTDTSAILCDLEDTVGTLNAQVARAQGPAPATPRLSPARDRLSGQRALGWWQGRRLLGTVTRSVHLQHLVLNERASPGCDLRPLCRGHRPWALSALHGGCGDIRFPHKDRATGGGRWGGRAEVCAGGCFPLSQ